VALLFLFDAATTVRHLAVGALVAMVVIITVGATVLLRQLKVVSRTLDWWARRSRDSVARPSRLEKLRTLEELVYGFAGRHPQRAAGLLALELGFHALGVLEIWVTLGLLAGADAPTLLSTFVLESVNRTIMVAFKFVPLRVGVDEVGTELLTQTLGLPLGLGVTMAIIRKARMIIWSAVGIVFVVRRGFSRILTEEN
jgi:hypothetical protein